MVFDEESDFYNNMNVNSLKTWLNETNFTDEKHRKAVNRTLIGLIEDCERHKKLLENLDLLEKSKQSTVNNFMKNAMENIVDSDKVIAMDVFKFLDGKTKRRKHTKRKSRRNYR